MFPKDLYSFDKKWNEVRVLKIFPRGKPSYLMIIKIEFCGNETRNKKLFPKIKRRPERRKPNDVQIHPPKM